ncbi:hypothetical protein OA93_15515 [Flavobacterium sp. KMS]|uniref:hypothetical protein n=1 Tax=Flavobacterium sp. KMS TaxID=1566023 RepID=UPI00057E1A7A|nr:hypothetical protein [Flavobacterium sp. KMS]KIA97330.1 hypothetical protein OA93_15515 [Flavobacterium sp. KMS]
MKLFEKKKIIYSTLNKNELIDVLNENVELFKKDNSRYLFEGKIDSDGNFIIYPSFDYNARNQIRPLIKGVVSDNFEKGLKIETTFNLPGMMKRLLGFVILLNLIVCVILYFNNLFLKWYMLLSFIVIFCLGVYAVYNEKVKKSANILERILK